MRKKQLNKGGEKELDISKIDEIKKKSKTINFKDLISQLNFKLINLKSSNDKIKKEEDNKTKTPKKEEEKLKERIDRNNLLNPNVEKIFDKSNNIRENIKYVETVLPNDDEHRKIFLQAILKYNTLMVNDYIETKNQYEDDLNKLITDILNVLKYDDLQNKEIIEGIAKIYNNHFVKIQELKKDKVNFYISKLKEEYGIFNVIIKEYKFVKLDNDIEVNKEGGRKQFKGGLNSLKYKDIQKPQYLLDKTCQDYDSLEISKRTFYDYIQDHENDRIRKDANLSYDVFSQLIEGNLVNTENIKYKNTKIDLLTGNESNNGFYERLFISQNYSRELIYYIESILIDNNELIEIFTDSHTEYLKSLNICDRYTINDYTGRLYDYYNLWKTNQNDASFVDLKYKLKNGIVPTELNNYLNSQIWKVLTYRRLLDSSVIVDFDTNDLLRNNLENVDLLLDEIFQLYELDLNRIIINAPPRLFAFTCFRGSKENYIQEISQSEIPDETTIKSYFKSTRFSSYTIDIFKNAASNFAGNIETSRIYETTVSPTAKILYIAPLSRFNNELEILQANDQIIDPLYQKEVFDIYNFRVDNDFDDYDLLCKKDGPFKKSIKHIKEIFLI